MWLQPNPQRHAVHPAQDPWEDIPPSDKKAKAQVPQHKQLPVVEHQQESLYRDN